MIYFNKTSLVGIIAAVLLTPVSIAQTAQNDVSGAVTQGAQFEEASRSADVNREGAMERSVIEGEPGLFILKRVGILSLSGTLGGGYSSNPGRTLDTSEESAFGNLALRAAVDTQIAQAYDAGMSLTASAIEYDSTTGPSNRTAVLNAYVGRPIFDGRLYVSANSQAGVLTDDKFGFGRAFYSFGANASSTFKLNKRTLVRPQFVVSRQWAGDEEQKNYSATAGVDVIWQPAKKWNVIGGFYYTRKQYDDFFEDVTFVERKDDQIRVSVGVSRSLSNGLVISGSYGYTTQDSTFFLSEYESQDGGLNLQLSRKF